MASLYYQPWMQLLVISLYIAGSYILLLNFMINITVLYSPPVVGSMLLFFSDGGVSCIIGSFTGCLRRQFLGLGSFASTFLFSEFLTGHFLSSLVPYSNSPIYGSLAIITYFVYEAYMQKCLVVSGLYLISMSYYNFWKSDFNLFFSEMLANTRLPKMQRWLRSWRWPM